MVVSVREKVFYKASGENQGDETIEPLLKCRKRIDEIKTEGWSLSRDKFGERDNIEITLSIFVIEP